MATNEERIAALEEEAIQQRAGSFTLLGIVKEIDQKVDSLRLNSAIVDARLTALSGRMDTQDARMVRMESELGTIKDQLGQIISLLKREGE